MASSSLNSVTKLVGRENFNTWKFAVKNYLEHEQLWKAVLGSETDEEKVTKARTSICLSIDPINYVHVERCQTAKEVWDKLNSTFEDTGLSRRVCLLRALITTKLEDFATVDEYVNSTLSTAYKLNGIDFPISDEWIGTFLLAGLPDEYRPMIMGIESSGIKITGDVIKGKLLQDVKVTSPSDSNAFYSSKHGNHQSKISGKHNQANTKSGIRCSGCSSYGNLYESAEYPQWKKNKNQSVASHVNNTKTQQSNSGFCADISSVLVDKSEWVIDSGAAYHMTMREDWMLEKYQHEVDEITVANDSKLEVKSAGKVIMPMDHGADNVLPINDVLHVPELSANLLSVSQIVSKGFTVVFNIKGCRFFDSSGKLYATGSHVNNMFKLNVFEENRKRCAGKSFGNKSEINNFAVLSFDEGRVQVDDESQTTIHLENAYEVENASDTDGNQENLSSDTDNDSFVSVGSNESDVTIVSPRRSERPHKQRSFPDCVSYFVTGIKPQDSQIVEETMRRHELWKKSLDGGEFNMDINQMDAVNAFIYGDVNKEINTNYVGTKDMMADTSKKYISGARCTACLKGSGIAI